MVKLSNFKDFLSSFNGESTLVILDPPHEIWPDIHVDIARLSTLACKNGYIICFCRLFDAHLIAESFKSNGAKIFDTIIWHDPQPCFIHSSRVLRNHEHILVFKVGEPFEPNMKLGEFNITKKSSKKGVSSIGKWNGSRRTYVPGDRKHLTSVMKYPRPLSGPLGRWQKPIGLISTLIQAYSRKSDIVIDPFCGSGTTGEACIQNQREYRLADIQSKAVKMTQDRLSK